MKTRLALLSAICVMCVCSTARAQTPVTPSVLKVAVVVGVDSPPLLEASGQPSPGNERALAEIESAFRVLSRLKLPFAISVSPVWVDELLAAEQTRVYASLLALATRHPLLHVPYAHAQLQLLPPTDVGGELARGEAALRQTLQAASQRILDPPGLALSHAVLRAARKAGITSTLAPASIVGSQPTIDSGVTLLPADDLPRTGGATSLLDKYDPTGRIALIARPTRNLAAALSALAADKRVKLVNITDVIGRPPVQAVDFPEAQPPPKSYTAALERGSDAVAGFASYTLPGNPTAKLLAVLLGRARSTVEWQRDWEGGAARADAAVDIAHAEQSLLSAANGSVTLTSQRGTVPVTLVNRARYPVRLRVRVTSPKLTFPGGDTKLVTISPSGMTITFVAEARATGSFPMDVSLSSVNGRVRFASGRVVVRSTAANVLALVLTLSGLLFLVGWSSRDLIRRVMRGRSR
jgi:hypothetical protein